MPEKRSNLSQPPTLRERAEGALRVSPPDIAGMSTDEIQKLVHELQVHQIELKIQNEELLNAQAELAQSRDRFNDLYDFAPVGYLTVDQDGTIVEANLTAARMLGVERKHLVGRRLTRFVAPEAQDALYLHQQAVFAGEEKQACDLQLRRADGTTLFARMESIGAQDPITLARHCRSAIINISERKLAETKMAASERRFRALTEKAAEDIILLDASGRVVYESPHETPLLGFAPGEMTGRSGFELVHPEDLPFARQKLGEVIGRPGAAIQGELRMCRKDGGWNWIHFFATNLLDEPAVGAVVLNLYNITERKEAEQALQRAHDELELRVTERTAELLATNRRLTSENTERTQAEVALRRSEEQLRQVISSAPNGIVVADGRGTIKLVNDQIEKLFGYTRSELLGKPVEILIPQRFQAGHPAQRDGFMAAPRARPMGAGRDLFARRKDGSEFPVEVGLVPIETAEGRNVLASVIDITERKQAEQALRESEERFRQVTGAIDQVFWMTDVDKQQMLYVSPGYERTWGRSCQSLYDAPHTWLEAIHPDDRARVRDAALTKQATSDYDLEYRILRPDGEERWIHDRAFPVRDAAGQVHRIAGLADDITERKRLHEEIIAAGERERERFGQNLHDGLCQILTAARLKADSLVTRLAGQEPATARSARSVVSLIAQAVDEAQGLARGLEPVEPLPEGLMSALQQLATSTSRLFNVNCTCEFPRAVLVADHKIATELFRITQEATNNAIKHGHAANIRIRFAEESGAAVLSVDSDGKPFPKRQRSLGMGLKTMRFRAARIGATIEIGRGPREGTIVRCVLPAAFEPAAPGPDAASPRQEKTTPP